MTLLCLVPLSGKAFHIDDPLFVWTAQHIVKHPLDPFGFRVAWGTTELPMWEVTKNPPLASYYCAFIGRIAGWSEKALHVGFLLPALTVVLGTYRLAQRLTRFPLAAAAATLLTPGFLVSSTSVMCDTMMLALWIMGIILWVEGLDPIRPRLLVGAGVLIGACVLTKYFGIALIPLLLAYSIERRRRLEKWAWYLMIPVLIVAGYQFWARELYGTFLLGDAVRYVLSRQEGSVLANTMVGAVFAGGCAISGLTFLPVVCSRKWMTAGIALVGLASFSSAKGWIQLPAAAGACSPWYGLNLPLALFMVGGLSILFVAIVDWRKNKDAESFLLFLWILGVFLFATYVNWTINARSVLPLIPAAGISLMRRSETAAIRRWFWLRITLPLVVAGILSVWVTWGDAGLANAARKAATSISERTRIRPGRVVFQGHWGFQYYMQSLGSVPFDARAYEVQRGDRMVIPENNTDVVAVPPMAVIAQQQVEIEMPLHVTTMSRPLAAGFYYAPWGPLPFAFGSIPAERYFLLDVAPVGAGQGQPFVLRTAPNCGVAHRR